MTLISIQNIDFSMRKIVNILICLFFISGITVLCILLYNNHTLNTNDTVGDSQVAECTTSDNSIIKTEHQQLESEQAIKVVCGFLKWYQVNYKKISEISLVDISGEFYSVDSLACEEYLRLLNNSGYVSHNYIKKWRTYFKEYSEQYKTASYSDGPPEGFEFDFVLHTQEIDDALYAINTIKILDCVIVDDMHRRIEIDIMPSILTFLLSYRQDVGWLIDSIN